MKLVTLSIDDRGCLDAYLKRIQYFGPLEKSFQVLCNLHEAHALHIPYDNLQMINNTFNVEPKLDQIICQIATNRLGAPCFQQNSVLKWLLTLLGFEVTLIGARTVHGMRDMSSISARTHVMLCVTWENEKYLCDVAYGSLKGFDFCTPIRPISVKADGTQLQQYGHFFRVIHKPELYGRLLQWHNGDRHWRDIYVFTLEPFLLADLKLTHLSVMKPGSAFSHNFICTKATKKGRLYLLNRVFIVYENGVKIRKVVQTMEEMKLILNDKLNNFPSDEQMTLIWKIVQKSKL
jgi:N-hydroxyarylamine O-acetyltransferase